MWPEATDTKELLRLAPDDKGAVDALFERHRGPLRRMIEMRLDPAIGRRVDASDVVQEVLLEASRRLPDYLRDPAMPFHLWLRQIARDRMIDDHRRHRLAGRRSVDRERPIAAAFADRSSLDLGAALRDRRPTPAAEAIRRELKRRFEEALTHLGDDDREVLLMRHFEHLSNREVAQALGLTESAAGMRHLRALRRLGSILGESPSALGTP
ncbi:MAG TPA: sigma-70 family RNA polymerase sigma factor [Isosphaeraceae bacterium]|jgi:RNA polymerase sigma-70 factor (ECF subfamily)|nr:sigma-70 family RNA polymerase sigma factor [Isosphaeraceae bacterium]